MLSPSALYLWSAFATFATPTIAENLGSHARRSDVLPGCEEACALLSEQYPTQNLLRNGTDFATTRAALWSTVQGAVEPACFFRPLTTPDVSAAITTARETQCKFAVKAGGHNSYVSSVIEGGLVIDLVAMDEVTVSEDEKSVALGPGGTWDRVYPVLEARGKIVPGGRMFGVGVGGLTLGGGISWLSSIYGWTCDNVLEYELVTANGEVINVTYESHPDLYWALRGGGSNYGVVTKFTMALYDQGKIWFSRVRFNSTASAVFNGAFAKWAKDLDSGDWRSTASLGWNAHLGGPPTGVALLAHADPQSTNDTHPAAFDDFFDNSLATSVASSNAFHSDIAKSLVFPAGVTRNSMWTTSFLVDVDMVQEAYRIWEEESRSVAPFAASQQLQIQTISVPQMEMMKRRGGNPSGLAGQKEAVCFLNILVQWRDSLDDGAAFAAQKRTEDRINAAAAERGLYVPYKYTNYASIFQDPYAGYGESNKQRLRDVAAMYDPEGVFQKLEPGGFKIMRDTPPVVPV
ncbi:hypothetical protein CkaCkLH20_06821 [Colletotrichum karsti]|uniref:FAD-binding PCMH-type domain-containing protein n=1 Tax=Colletotrichum karsti TaxID=1095194 RepID=A0A9P6I4I7_9PEZI|nr:uncharacterized protein CkaCkLH20_06821 [Colletotrichum karsti]KAF9875889.1 hypothetical protein CkaCkLH20_06821 [Colletotrichum karsti]